MPLYEYECEACGEVQEVLQGISDPPPEQCRGCEGGPLHKKISRTSFVLKGTGWYVTDFRDKDSGKKNAEGAETASSSEGSAEGGGSGGENQGSGGESSGTKESGGSSESGSSSKGGGTSSSSESSS